MSINGISGSPVLQILFPAPTTEGVLLPPLKYGVTEIFAAVHALQLSGAGSLSFGHGYLGISGPRTVPIHAAKYRPKPTAMMRLTVRIREAVFISMPPLQPESERNEYLPRTPASGSLASGHI
jgi:hypothetical protein